MSSRFMLRQAVEHGFLTTGINADVLNSLKVLHFEEEVFADPDKSDNNSNTQGWIAARAAYWPRKEIWQKQ